MHHFQQALCKVAQVKFTLIKALVELMTASNHLHAYQYYFSKHKI